VKLKHIPREENTAADSLSRLAFDRNLNINNAIFTIQIDEKVIPLDMHHIGKKQLTDELLKKKSRLPKHLRSRTSNIPALPLFKRCNNTLTLA